MAGAAENEATRLAGAFRLLLDRYRTEVASGTIDGARKVALDSVLHELEQLCARPPGNDAHAITAWVSRMRALMGRVAPLAQAPARAAARAPVSAEAERIQGASRALHEYLQGELMRSQKHADESQIVLELTRRLGEAVGALGDARDGDEALRIEGDVLRPLGHEVREYAQRAHPTLADPRWACPPVTVDPNAVFFSGTDVLRERVAAACERRRLKLLGRVRTATVGQGRWDLLRRSGIAAFDLGAPDGRDLAAVCYEIGLALVLGKSMVVFAPHGRRIPFDVDVEPVRIADTDSAERLAEGLDEAIYAQQRGGADTGVPATTSEAERRLASGLADVTRRHLLDERPDPIRARRVLEQALGLAGPGAPRLFLSSWPATYPDPAAPRCFHVTPFQPGWAAEVKRIARSACPATMRYARGDDLTEPWIVRSIWDEIGRANRVIVDLTGLNPNVALELGIAHGLGRTVILLTQDEGIEESLFPAIAGERVHRYALDGRGESLTSIIGPFLGGR